MRVGIVPAFQGKGDAVRRDERKNLIVCPIPYDGEFMEVFYNAWNIVQQFINADGRLPKEVSLPVPAHRQVARELDTRREFPVLDVIEALGPISQPELLGTQESSKSLATIGDGQLLLEGLISPIPSNRGNG